MSPDVGTGATGATGAPRALVLTERLEPGGKLSHVVTLCAGLESIGWRVELIDRSAFSLLERAWIVVPDRLLRPFDRVRGHHWFLPAYLRTLERHLRARIRRDGPPSVLSLHEPFVVEVARRAAPGVPVVLTVHGPAHAEVASGYGVPIDHPTVQWLREYERRAFLEADAVVSVDQAHADYVRSFGRRDRIWVIPNAVDTRRFHPGVRGEPFPPDVEAWIAGRPIVFCARLLVPKNGVDVAVEAARRLRDRGPACALLVAGDGPERERLAGQVHEYGLEGHVRFLGTVDAAPMPGWCARASVVIVPSVSHKGVEEATSISAIEGQACARPVVASALGGLREVVTDGVNGLLVPPGDPDALADAVRRVLLDSALAARLGAAAAENVRAHHALDAWARRFAEVFEAAGAR